MKERPIIFSSTTMVKAIMEGRKTQTRRVAKPQPQYSNYGYWDWNNSALVKTPYKGFYHGDYDGLLKAMLFVCPYGQVGDRLWVKETYILEAPNGMPEDSRECASRYKADGLDISDWLDVASGDIGGKWCSPIFMPRWASRITLEIIEVRVERLQEIVFTDIVKEGINPQGKLPSQIKAEFIELWDSLNVKRGYSWDKNSWCWVISFIRIKM